MSNEGHSLQLAPELRIIVTRLIKKLRSKSSVTDRLSLTERSVIKLIDEYKELLASELAAKEKITAQSMSQILNHLSEMGYISRKVSGSDKRKVFISLSKEGQNLLHKTRNERDEWLSRAIKETLTAREQETLHKALGPLAKLVEFD